jgi:hypothetical protein
MRIALTWGTPQRVRSHGFPPALLAASALRRHSKQQERTMRLSAAQVEIAASQLQAEALPENHPLIPKLNELFGDHTFFLDSHGLSVVEQADREAATGSSTPSADRTAVVVNLANWTDSNPPKLEAHEPELTDSVVTLSTNGG